MAITKNTILYITSKQYIDQYIVTILLKFTYL